ncbi:MAG: VOC family protein [Burkholderiales bacterium]|jgi:catechol 2,3-dioxygenase-like lactoylglutathione lyase family enzyme
MFSILGLDHVVLRTANVPRMVRFYCEVLGCTVEKERSDIGLTQLRAGNSLIDLVAVDGAIGRKGGAAPGTEGRNMDHLCLRIEPFDPGALTTHLIQHGVVPGEIKPRYGADGTGPSLYLSDPEGNTVELKGPPDSRPAA